MLSLIIPSVLHAVCMFSLLMVCNQHFLLAVFGLAALFAVTFYIEWYNRNNYFYKTVVDDSGKTETRKTYHFTALPLICVIDILFMPYVRELSASFSMLLVVGWSVIHILQFKNDIKMQTFVLFGAAAFLFQLIFFSSLIGVSEFIILGFSFLLLHYIKQYASKISIKHVLFIYLAISFIFSLIYIVLPQTYFDIRSAFTMNGVKINFHSRNMNRFTFIFSDPNNAACAYVGILAYLVLFEKLKKPTELVFAFVSVGICVVTTFSMTGALMLAALMVALLIIKYETKKTCLYVMGGLAAAVVVVILGAWLFAGASILENEIVAAAIKRFSNQSVGTAGGRVSFWEKTINSALEWYNIVIGKGAVIDGKGVEYLPHSGHLYLLISYGLPINIVFYLTFFKLDKKNLWNTLVVLMPLFMAFTINTGLGDYRFMTVMTLLIAYMQQYNQPKPKKRKCLYEQNFR